MGKYLQVKIQLQKTDVKHRCNWNCLESNFSILKSLSELMQSLRKKNMIDLESFHIILVAWSCLLWSLEDRPEESCLLGLYWSPCMLKAEALGKFLPVQHILLSMSQWRVHRKRAGSTGIRRWVVLRLLTARKTLWLVPGYWRACLNAIGPPDTMGSPNGKVQDISAVTKSFPYDYKKNLFTVKLVGHLAEASQRGGLCPVLGSVQEAFGWCCNNGL